MQSSQMTLYTLSDKKKWKKNDTNKIADCLLSLCTAILYTKQLRVVHVLYKQTVTLKKPFRWKFDSFRAFCSGRDKTRPELYTTIKRRERKKEYLWKVKQTPKNRLKSYLARSIIDCFNTYKRSLKVVWLEDTHTHAPMYMDHMRNDPAVYLYIFFQAIHLGKKIQFLQGIAHKRYIGMCTLQHRDVLS